ncbi:MAG: hypothetical protein PHT48_09580 [Dechloromonas sp.]|nr:hypothetical protein [Dechloromonas sp.]
MADTKPLKTQNGGLEQYGDGDTLAIAHGGTGATTVVGARENLLIIVSATEPESPAEGTIWIDTSVV